ncbi:MAG: transporter, partial [Bergeyella zoohelcum]|nr:transporter [Bergeyella zoohelcum]
DSFATSFNIGSTSGFSTYTLTNGWYYSFNKFTIFGEYFANFTPSETPQHNLDFGIMYPITSNLQIDFAFGRSIFSNTANAFATTGIAYRFLNKKYRKH